MNPTAVVYNAFFGSEATGFVELRIRNRGGGMAQRFFQVGDVPSVVAAIAEFAPKTDVFWGVAPRIREEGKRTAIERVHTLWVDCDGEHAVAALRAFRPLPAIVIGSGSGSNVHAFWPLLDPIEPEEAETANRQLSYRLGADVRSTDAARILRPPGSMNHKGPEPRPVEVRRLHVDVFELQDIVGNLPPVVEPRRRGPLPAAAHSAFAAGDVLATIEPRVYVEALTGREVGRDGKVSCPFHEDRTPSLHCYPTPEGGHYCFSCGHGGSAVDLASALWDIEPRGGGFHELCRRLAEEILGAEAGGAE